MRIKQIRYAFPQPFSNLEANVTSSIKPLHLFPHSAHRKSTTTRRARGTSIAAQHTQATHLDSTAQFYYRRTATLVTMWSFIRTILLLLVASFIVAAEFNITAQMIGPDGKVVHLDPNRDFTPFTRHHHHHNHRLQSERLGSSNSDALFSFNWCGAVANSDSSDNTSWIEAVEGRFIVPTMETNSTLKAAQQVVAFVGLDGYSCRTGFLQGGVWSTVCNNDSDQLSDIDRLLTFFRGI